MKEGLRDPLFLRVQFLNVHMKDKGTPSISVRLNLTKDNLIYVQNRKGRVEVIGYQDPDSGLFVAEEKGQAECVYQQFRKKAVAYANEELNQFLSQLESLSDEDYKERGYRPYPILAAALKQCLVDRQALYADLQKQVNLIASTKFPKVNEFVAFSNDEVLSFPVTARLPYRNPQTVTLSEEQKMEVETFLSVFFDDYNRYVFSWYFGAVLSNIPIYDDRIGKMAILSSHLGGSGKSTLVTALCDAMLSGFCDIQDDFDSFFVVGNRFGTSTLSSKRLSVYSEASFSNDPLSDDHNFTGLNVSSLKSMITEGYIAAEEKFGDRNMERLSGFHLVLTNFPPLVTAENQAMNRRILPIMMRPTPMSEKAKQLKLWGRQTMDAYLREKAELFAAYFVSVFRENEYAFLDIDYNHRDYLRDIKDSGDDLNEELKQDRKKLDALRADGFLKWVEGVEKKDQLDLSVFKADVMEIAAGGARDGICDHIRISTELNGRFLYVDASKSFLLRYGTASTNLRNRLKEYYGEPAKKFHLRMFTIPF